MRTRTSSMWKCVAFSLGCFYLLFPRFFVSALPPFFLSLFLHFFASLFLRFFLSSFPRFFASSFPRFPLCFYKTYIRHFLIPIPPSSSFLPSFLPSCLPSCSCCLNCLLILVFLILRKFLFDTYPRSVGATRLPSAELALPTSESPGSHWFLSISSQRFFEIWRLPSLAFWDRSLWYSWTFRSCDGEVTLRKKWCYTEQIGSLNCDMTCVEVFFGACLVAIDIATKSISVTVHTSTHDFCSSSCPHSRGRAFTSPLWPNGHWCTCEIEWSICRTWDPMLLGCSLDCRTVVATASCGFLLWKAKVILRIAWSQSGCNSSRDPSGIQEKSIAASSWQKSRLGHFQQMPCLTQMAQMPVTGV